MPDEGGRREKAETLAALDAQVHQRLHLLAARVANDAPCPQRSRPEFHAIPKPIADFFCPSLHGMYSGERKLIIGVVIGANDLLRVQGSCGLARWETSGLASEPRIVS